MNPYKRMFDLESRINSLSIRINGLAEAAAGLKTVYVLNEIAKKLILKTKLIDEYQRILKYYDQLPKTDKYILKARYKYHTPITEIVGTGLSYRTIQRRLEYYGGTDVNQETQLNTK